MLNFWQRDKIAGYAFVVPAFILLFAILIFPYGYAIYLSFHDLSLSFVPRFVGLSNFKKVLADPAFFIVVKNQFVLVIFSGVLQFALGMIGAVALNKYGRLTHFLRAGVLIPWVIPGVVAALLWRWILDGHSGIFNYLLQSAGLIEQSISWLANDFFSMCCLIMVNVWRVFPFNLVMFLSGLQGVPAEQLEAASIDGAGGLQRFLYVTLPNLRQIIITTTILTAIWNFKIFDVVWTLTKGGPGGATEVFSTMIYRSSFIRLDFGYASAIAVVMAIIILLPIILYMNYAKQD